MKKIKSLLVWGTLGVLVLFSSCKKENVDKLGGEWDLPMTKVGSESSIYVKMGSYDFPTLNVVVTNNDKGIVTYKLKIDPDLNGHPDSALLKDILDDIKENKLISIDEDGLIDVGFDLKVTSEGYQILSQGGTPQTIIRYNDPVGTKYSFDNVYSNTKIQGEITEKTGMDDWPFLFYYIKTSKVEFKYPNDFPFVDKVSLRANHRFGLVYLEIKFKGNQTINADIVQWGAVD